MIGLPHDMGYLTPEMKEKATKELGENDQVRRKTLLELRNLIKEKGQFTGRNDDDYLLIFLRARKFNVERTFELLSNYYHIKKTHTEVYGHADFHGFKETIAKKVISILPYRDHEGCSVFVLNLEKWNTQGRKFASIVHDLTVAVLYCVEDPGSQVCGIKVIADMKALSFTHMKYVQPKYIQLIAKGMKCCLPARFKAIHVVNESPIFQYFWSVLRIVLTDKLRNRVHFHSSNMSSLLKHFPAEIIPKEYSGKIEVDSGPMVKKIEALKDLYYERISLDYTTKPSVDKE